MDGVMAMAVLKCRLIVLKIRRYGVRGGSEVRVQGRKRLADEVGEVDLSPPPPARPRP